MENENEKSKVKTTKKDKNGRLPKNNQNEDDQKFKYVQKNSKGRRKKI